MTRVDKRDKHGSRFHSFRVTVRRQQVERFHHAISRAADSDSSRPISVPLTFPATWFGLSEVKSKMMETVNDSQHPTQKVLLHLEQNIEMLGQLEVGHTYSLKVHIGELKDNSKLLVSAEVIDPKMGLIANMTSQFALVDPTEQSS